MIQWINKVCSFICFLKKATVFSTQFVGRQSHSAVIAIFFIPGPHLKKSP